MLSVSGLTKSFGGLTAVDDVDFDIDDGNIVGLIGPNGAGKSTMFNCITGVYEPDRGSVTFDGQELLGRKPSEICKLGVCRTFQIVRTFSHSTVRENVVIGATFGGDSPSSKAEAEEVANSYLSFVGLEDMADLEANKLTIAERKRVELARGLATEPDVLLLDEIASGLNQSEVNELCEVIVNINEEYDVTILWIEHIMDAIMSTTDRILVLNEGRKIAEGTSNTIRSDQTVVEAYLGEEV